MPEYATIKQLVLETCIAEGRFPSCEKLTALVRQHFPQSAWKERTHYSWYKSQVNTGRLKVPGFSPEMASDGDDDEMPSTVEDLIEATVSLEKDLHTYLINRLDTIEPGLVLVEGGVEYQTAAGRVDLLARDSEARSVVIELKAGRAGDAALGQLLGYMGCLPTTKTSTRGILIAAAFDERVIHATKGLPQLKLLKYSLSFRFEQCSLNSV
jgi:RecB family endonuclease NucS